MTTRVPSYTVAELEQETGFDRRTIAYYVQEDLLPRVGRRGPRTRYPKLVRDRLLFIRRVREAEEAGRVPAVSLSEMRKIFERVSPALIAGVADGRLAVTADLVLPASTAFRLPEMRKAALRARVERGEVARRSPRGYAMETEEEPDELAPAAAPAAEEGEVEAGPEPPGAAPADWERAEAAWSVREHPHAESEPARSPVAAARLAELLGQLQEAANRGGGDPPRTLDTWTRVGITPEIVLSVRNVTAEDGELVERVRRLMRRVISGG